MKHVFAVPILPGRTATFRQMCAEIQGPRLAAFSELQHRCGVVGEWNWIQSGPTGDLALALIETATDDGIRDRMVQGLAEMPESFTTWFRTGILECFGFDPGLPTGALANELVLAWRADARS